MISRSFLISSVCLALATGCATSPASAPASYIASAHLDATKFLAAPDPSASAQHADLAAVQAAQALKGAPRWSLAQADDDISPYSAFGAVLGPDFTKARTAKTAALFTVLFADVKALEITPANLTKTISAFANTDGGDLYVGIDEIGLLKLRQWDGFSNQEAANGHLQIFEKLFHHHSPSRFQYLLRIAG